MAEKISHEDKTETYSDGIKPVICNNCSENVFRSGLLQISNWLLKMLQREVMTDVGMNFCKEKKLK